MELFSEKPQPGDIIEIFSIGYKGWAIYMGDGDVIHLTACPGELPKRGLLNFFTNPGGKAKVTKETLKEAAKGSFYWVNNHLDHEFRSQPMHDIIASAQRLINKRVNYKVCVKNCEKFVNDLRYGQIPRPLSSDNPQPGDLIEISRKVYLHWAVYVGEGYVVHLVGPGMLSSASSYSNDNSIRLFKGKVLRELLEIVVDKDEYRINNSWDNKYRPKPVQEIIQLAEANVGKPRFYQVLLSNCEHFACEMRYGRRHSTQVKIAAAGALLGAVLI